MKFLTNENEVAYTSDYQIFYFYASWMPFNKKMKLMLSNIEKNYNNLSVIAIDIDYFKTFISRFNLESIPTMIIYHNGVELDRIVGIVMSSAFKSKINNLLK